MVIKKKIQVRKFRTMSDEIFNISKVTNPQTKLDM